MIQFYDPYGSSGTVYLDVARRWLSDEAGDLVQRGVLQRPQHGIETWTLLGTKLMNDDGSVHTPQQDKDNKDDCGVSIPLCLRAIHANVQFLIYVSCMFQMPLTGLCVDVQQLPGLGHGHRIWANRNSTFASLYHARHSLWHFAPFAPYELKIRQG